MKFAFVLLTVCVAYTTASVVLPFDINSPDLLKLPELPTQSKQGRITNGEEAVPGQFPYQVGLRLEIGSKSGWCGGTLISDTYIVTAAHCAQRANSAIVYLGAFDIQNNLELHQQRVYVPKKNIIVHENWSRLTLQNDIALLKLPVAIAFNTHIQPATLPKKAETYPTYEGETVVASGWGLESDEATSVSRFLRYIEVPIMKEARCNRMFFGVITEHMICIDTTGGKSTCSGDSGGPLVYQENGINTLIGSTSFGISFGCEIGWPGVFTRTTSYVDWIEEKTGVVNK